MARITYRLLGLCKKADELLSSDGEFRTGDLRLTAVGPFHATEMIAAFKRAYARALLNRAALNALGITRDTPNPPGGAIEKDARGNPTGMLIAKPSALVLYSTLAQGPKLPLAPTARHHEPSPNG